MSEPRLYVERYGEGPALVLLHGLAGSARNFRPQARRLADRHRCVLYDARGHARSDAPVAPEAYRLETLVADLGRVLDEEGLESACVGGLSLGAATAAHYAVRWPERVRALVLASPPAGAGGEGVSATARAFADAIDRDGLEAAGERFVWGPDSGLDPRGAALVKQGFLEHPPHALSAILRGVIADLEPLDRLAPRLRETGIPVLLIAGTADPPSLAATRALAGALPEARHVELEGAGHVVNLERPAEVSEALVAFVEGVMP